MNIISVIIFTEGLYYEVLLQYDTANDWKLRKIRDIQISEASESFK